MKVRNMFEQGKDSLWSSRPSLRAIGASTVFVAMVTAAVWVFSPYLIMSLYKATSGVPFWSVEVIKVMQWVLRGIVGFGLLLNVIKLIKMWSIRYEVTPTRFLYHHGILIRKHDEIELQRIRDYRVLEPIFSKGLGLGTVELITRDETHPLLKIGPFVDARHVQEVIREGVERHKSAVGFREFEST
jgi:uncharacterized membrane protein YdbT with pleckstrin-like domain